MSKQSDKLERIDAFHEAWRAAIKDDYARFSVIEVPVLYTVIRLQIGNGIDRITMEVDVAALSPPGSIADYGEEVAEEMTKMMMRARAKAAFPPAP